MNVITAVLLILFLCAGCREEVAMPKPVQTDSSASQKRDGRILAIEREMSNMPQKLAGAGWDTMFWGSDLAKSIMALDDRNERVRLMNRYMDELSGLQASLNAQDNHSRSFYNYEFMMESCTIFGDEPEILERFLGIMCECIRLHRREIKKWAEAISREPNRRKRVPMKNIHSCLSSDFMVFTNRIERDYFPWMQSLGLPEEQYEHWRRQIDVAYEIEATDEDLHHNTGK